MSKIKYNDHPFDTVCKTVEEYAKQGVKCYQKFTCENCGSRQTMEDANVFYTEGSCEECKHVTDIKRRGCNYMAIFPTSKEGIDALSKMEDKDS